MTVLHEFYRPKKLDDVVGQDVAARALSGVIKRGASRVFLLSGPSGVGKTTMARIAARMMGCEDNNVRDVNAAVNTGIDAMRGIQEIAHYRPLGKSAWRALVLDECHRLSGQAWDSLLKALEEPPPCVAWFLCTTDPRKVPQTIKTRCTAITLSSVSDADLRKLLQRVTAAEKMSVARDVLDAVVSEAGGSARQMLQNLSLCRDVRDRREAMTLLRSARESDGVAELGKFLLSGGSWAQAMLLLSKLADESPESVRIAVCNYLGGALRGAKSDRQACAVLTRIEPFAAPFPPGTEKAALAVAIGRAMYAGGE